MATLPGHTIPYHLTEAETRDFLTRHAHELDLGNYIFTKRPPSGIIVREDYGEFAVWFDASGRLHIIDVTNMTISKEIQKAEYESPDSSFVKNLYERIVALAAQLPTGAQTMTLLEIVALLAIVYMLMSMGRRAA